MKGNMYKFVDKTWNPLAGECPHKCSYCSTNSLKRFPVIQSKYSGEPRIDMKALNSLNYEGKKVFVVGQNDLFAVGVSNELIQTILMRCNKFDNDYIIQTKNPDRILGFQSLLPKRCTVITTIETNRVYPDIMGNTPSPNHRVKGISGLNIPTQLTIEPILDFDLDEFVEIIKLCNVGQVNLGADSKRNNLPEPSSDKIGQLIHKLSELNITIHLKSNLKRLWNYF